MTDKADYVKLGLTCSDVCKALDRGLDGIQTDQLSRSVLEEIEQLTTYVGPMTQTPCDSPTEPSTVGLWIRSRGRSSSGVDEMRSFDISTERVTMRKSLPGS